MNQDRGGDVLVIGEALVDLLAGPDGTQESFGGSPANTALALGRLGRRVRLATALGADGRAQGIRRWLSDAGVRVESTTIPRTATAEAALGPDGSATYAFDIEWNVALSTAESPALVHTGSIAIALDPGAAAVEGYLLGARERSTISIDPNIRPALVGAGQRARIERVLALADVVKLSDEDLAWLAPGVSPRVAATRWLDAGASLVVVTRGARGALGFAPGLSVTCAARRVHVVDTVAAGDTFTAALLDGLAAEDLVGASRRYALRQLEREALERVLARATQAAAITVGRRGANPPTRAELASAMG